MRARAPTDAHKQAPLNPSARTHASKHAHMYTRTDTQTHRHTHTHTHTHAYTTSKCLLNECDHHGREKFLLQVLLQMLWFSWTLTGFTSVFQNGSLFSEEISERRRSRYKCNQSEFQKCVDTIGLSFRKIACQTFFFFYSTKAKMTTMAVKRTSTKIAFRRNKLCHHDLKLHMEISLSGDALLSFVVGSKTSISKMHMF